MSIMQKAPAEFPVSPDDLTRAPASMPNVYTAEASELGMPPGVWPTSLKCAIGNGLPFMTHKISPTGEFVIYRQCAGMTDIIIYND